MGCSATRLGNGLPDDDMKVLWFKLLWRSPDGQPYQDFDSFLFLSDTCSTKGLI